MNSPLHFLRDWLPFGRRRAGGKTGEELRGWLDGLHDAPPVIVAAELGKTMPRLIGEEANLHMRLKLLDALYAETLRIAPALESAVHNAPLPLPAAARAQALAADNLLKVLASGYNSVIVNIEQQNLAGGLGHLLQHAILNVVQILARRQQLAYRAYAPASESSWRHLHRHYRIARQCGLAASGDADERIETHYLAALLLAFADPTRFSRSTIDQLAAACRHLAPGVRVIDPRLEKAVRIPPGGALFVVAAGASRPGRIKIRPDEDYATDELIIDCTDALTELRREIAARDRADHAAPPAALAAPLQGVAALLPGLLGVWHGVPNRRFSRQRFKPRAELVSGIEHLSRFVASAAFRRRRDDRARDEPGVSISEWSVIDESPDGFGVRFIRGEMRAIEVGEIIGLRTKEESRIHICLVRRVSNLGPGRLEFGLQELSPQAIGITLAAPQGQACKAMLLPTLPAFGGAGGIVAAPGVLRRDSVLPHDGRETAGFAGQQRIGKLIESNQRCEVFLLDPIDAAATVH